MRSLPVVPLHHEPTDVLLAHGVHCRYPIRFQATKQTLHRCVELSGCTPLCHAKITLDDYWEAAYVGDYYRGEHAVAHRTVASEPRAQHHLGLLLEPDPQTSMVAGLDGEP